MPTKIARGRFHAEEPTMARKDRSDITIGAFEEKHDLPPGSIRHPDGRDVRSDMKLGTLRKEAEKTKEGKKPKRT